MAESVRARSRSEVPLFSFSPEDIAIIEEALANPGLHLDRLSTILSPDTSAFSVAGPEQFGINQLLFSLAFGDSDFARQAQAILMETVYSPLFPVLEFVNRETIEILLPYLERPDIVLCSCQLLHVIMLQEGAPSLFQEEELLWIVHCVELNHGMSSLLLVMMVLFQPLFESVLAAIYDILLSLIQDSIEDVALTGVQIMTVFLKSNSQFDVRVLVPAMVQRFENNIGADVSITCFEVLAKLDDPPIFCLPWILLLLKSENPELMMRITTIITVFSAKWSDEAKLEITSAILGVVHKEMPFLLTLSMLLALVSLSDQQSLPLGDVRLFEMCVDMFGQTQELALLQTICKTIALAMETGEHEAVLQMAGILTNNESIFMDYIDVCPREVVNLVSIILDICAHATGMVGDTPVLV
jgi:hypothetical protein